MTLASYSVKKLEDATHTKEKLFWLGAILASYAGITGSNLADSAAIDILEETQEWMRKNYKKSY